MQVRIAITEEFDNLSALSEVLSITVKWKKAYSKELDVGDISGFRCFVKTLASGGYEVIVKVDSSEKEFFNGLIYRLTNDPDLSVGSLCTKGWKE